MIAVALSVFVGLGGFSLRSPVLVEEQRMGFWGWEIHAPYPKTRRYLIRKMAKVKEPYRDDPPTESQVEQLERHRQRWDAYERAFVKGGKIRFEVGLWTERDTEELRQLTRYTYHITERKDR